MSDKRTADLLATLATATPAQLRAIHAILDGGKS